ncbi:hypothetical protein [Bradyrhizobium canariense]|uniref:Uncharacterized protein n=1 Tax=Bradyrhizobium canariense TaxID=255045 RepID=A0A1H1R8Z1_9BRAD|nr:hypothetical protein [Bradyrhizobium canariense]SDS32135.1 hypothetical protein SAMN05444158_1694 [Bradyrhizobium canariense]
MLKWLVTAVLNRLVFVTLLFLAVSTLTKTSCYPGDNPISQIGRAISSLRQFAEAFQKH